MTAAQHIASILGPYLIIVGLSPLLYPARLMTALERIKQEPIVPTLMGGALNILLGLTILHFHSAWNWRWESLVTLMGFLILFKGIVAYFSPNLLWNRVVTSRPSLIVWGIIAVVIGTILCYGAWVQY